METTIVYWGYIGIMKKKMEATIDYWDLDFVSCTCYTFFCSIKVPVMTNSMSHPGPNSL